MQITFKIQSLVLCVFVVEELPLKEINVIKHQSDVWTNLIKSKIIYDLRKHFNLNI